jgi:hypothetical protein
MSVIRDRIDELLDRRREVRATAELEAEIDRLRTQNERLRAAMRRCVTCDYRLAATGDRATDPTDPTDPTDLPTDGAEPPTPVAEGAEP